MVRLKINPCTLKRGFQVPEGQFHAEWKRLDEGQRVSK
jgi:hypothetical protein